MTRSVGTAVENSFIAGFVTEHSGLNFPENACVDVSNCVFTESGEVRRRAAIDIEASYILRVPTQDSTSVISSSDIVKSFLWTSAGTSNDISLVVNQIGNTLHIFEDNQGVAVSRSDVHLTFNLENRKISGTGSTARHPCAMIVGNGKLFVAHRYMQPFFLEYDEIKGVINYTAMTIKIRDFKVFDDGFDNDEQPLITDSNVEHLYNLYNQGWTDVLLTDWATKRQDRSQPAKSQLPWYFRDPTLYDGGGGYGFWKHYTAKYALPGTTLAPRGKFLLDAFNQDRQVAANVSGLPIKTSGGERPTTVAFMNSRTFYGGVKADGYGATIYFSNILKDTSNEILFYQRNDPTSEVSYELLPNDGGSIVIPDAENIIEIKAVKNYLLVFCTNGLWSISGSEGVGFTATDYSIEKLSDTPLTSSNSLIIVDNTPIWWNNDGIYIVQISQGNTNVASLTKPTIQSFFNKIPTNCKYFATPLYNRLTAEVMWFYSSNSATPRYFDSVLTFKTTTKAFYKTDITPYAGIQIRGVTYVVNRAANNVYDNVTDTSAIPVTDTAGNVVTIKDTSPDSVVDAVFPILFVYVPSVSKFTFANFVDNQFVDWLSYGNSAEFDSWIDTGYRIRGDAIRKFQVSSIEVYTRYVAGSSCKMSGIWDYTTDERTGGFTVEQEVCTNDAKRSTNFRRLRVRGSGLTLQLRFKSVGSAPFHLIGWSAQEMVNDRA